MIRVTVELLYHGHEDMVKVTEEVFICNDGTGTKDLGNYSIHRKDPRPKGYRKKKFPDDEPGKVVRRIKDWPRNQRTLLRLVHEALGKVLNQK